MNRMGRGYSFDVIRARLLYDQDALQNASGTVRKSYGSHIQTLARKLETGEFA
jgi:hypothetical protein